MKILTFDLEDWFHILDHEEVASSSSWEGMESRIERNTDRILALLEEENTKSTWFCLGWVAKKYPKLIRKLALKHELACHSMEHKLLFEQGREGARKDILENIKVLEDISGKKINAYRAPGFSFTTSTRWLPELLNEAGISYDCSIFPARRNHGGYAEFPFSEPCRIFSGGIEIKEFPLSVFSFLGRKIVYSGGGYFRLIPYPLVSAMMKKADYVMTYFHPRDFDNGQPVIKSLPLKRKFMSYTGLKNSFSKLKRMLNDHTFIALEEAGGQINWEKAPVINLEKL